VRKLPISRKRVTAVGGSATEFRYKGRPVSLACQNLVTVRVAFCLFGSVEAARKPRKNGAAGQD
jgi:hypothetical protein